MDQYQYEFGLRWLLRHMDICPNAYYNYRRNTKAEYYKHRDNIYSEIKKIYHDLNGVIGRCSMKVFLDQNGIYHPL